MSSDQKLLVPLYNRIGGPETLVGHSYGGHVITNSAYNNPNVTGIVYIAASAPDEGQSLSNLINLTRLSKDLMIFYNGGFPTKSLQCSMEPLLKMWILKRLTLWQ